MVSKEELVNVRSRYDGYSNGQLNNLSGVCYTELMEGNLSGESLLRQLIAYWAIQLKKYKYLGGMAKDYAEGPWLSNIIHEYEVLLSGTDWIEEMATLYCLKQGRYCKDMGNEVSSARWLEIAGEMEKIPGASMPSSC